MPRRFTHVDPFEDTESREQRHFRCRESSFTHVDPFEDTESASHLSQCGVGKVSPTSIRSRILKATAPRRSESSRPCFTHVDPFEDTES